MPIGRLLVLIFSLSLAYQATTHPLPQSQGLKPPVSLPSRSGTALPGGAVVNTTPAEHSPNQASSELRVIRVIDGDTIELTGGIKVRYIGIDTPEVVDPRKPVQCFGVEASAGNKALVLNQTVRLEKDISETDKYGRLLRYVWVGDNLVNERLVRQGLARSSSYPPDIRYQDRFRSAETEARNAGRGLWSACTSPSAAVTQPIGTPSKTPPDPACPIKGNISSSGKIYHLPGQRFYNSTVIDPTSGERWFCSETEALAEGWRKSKL